MSGRVFTTGQVAKICNVAPKTVAKWFDSGCLKGYRIPGSQDRRIPVENLLKFMTENDFPTQALAELRVVLFFTRQDLIMKLEQAFSGNARCSIVTVGDTVSAALASQKIHLFLE